MIQQLKQHKYWLIPVSIAAALMLVAGVPHWKSLARETLSPEKRVLLATAEGNVLNNGTRIEVVKVQTRDTLQLEVYRVRSNGNLEKLDNIELPGSRNAHFTVSNQASNLALLDVNSDGHLDIVSSFVDNKLTPRLVAFTWNNVSQTFDTLSEIQLQVADL